MSRLSQTLEREHGYRSAQLQEHANVTSLPMLRTFASADTASVDQLDSQSVFAFASPSKTIITAGPIAVLGQQSDEDLSRLLRQLRDAGFVETCIVGCHPFDSTGQSASSAQLFLAPRPTVGKSLDETRVSPNRREKTSPCDGPPASSTAPSARWSLDRDGEETSRQTFVAAVRNALQKMRTSPLRKVVLARAIDLYLNHDQEMTPSRMANLIGGVLLQQRARYGFAVRLPANEHGGVGCKWLFGLSPELLLRKSGPAVESFPLAGSVARSHDALVDSERATALLRSDKDLREHRFVVEAIADQLGPHCSELRVPAAPELVSTSTLWHLGTQIRGTLKDPEHSSHALAKLLHPTPAVCGFPRDLALETIKELEGLNRDYFAGMVGWCDAAGDGEWAVSIRCGELESRRLRLYAGAGIVEGSQPELELAETEAKLRTLLDALGVDSRGEQVSRA